MSIEDLDLLIASDFGTSEVVINQGDGSFRVATDRRVITDENGMGMAIGDYNNDGRMDWFITATHNGSPSEVWPWGTTGNRMYAAAGPPGHFADATDDSKVRNSRWGWGTCAADFDNDGWLDIFAENGFGFVPDDVVPIVPPYIARALEQTLGDYQRETPSLFINQGNAIFEDQAAEWGLANKTNGRGVVCVDFDRDGDIDIVVAQNSDKPLVHENKIRGKNGNHFVGFTVLGAQPNSLGIGTLITITNGGGSQIRQVSANSNFLGQNPTTVHFGIGEHLAIDAMTVRWPDGVIEQFTEVAIDTYSPLVHPDLRGLVK